MPKLPKLSGTQVIKILEKDGWQQARQRGSHVILTKTFSTGKKGTVVPLHKELDTGTLLNIIRQVGLTREEFLKLR